MRKSYKDVEINVPYNSAGKILLAENQHYPEELGGNCVYQSKLLAERLRDQGFDPSFIYSSDHVAVVCDIEGEIYFMDPSLMHGEPKCLNKIFADRDVYVCECFSQMNGGFWRLGFTKKDVNRMNVNLIREKKNGDIKFVQTYQYDLGEVKKELSDVADPRIAFSPNRKILSMNCVRNDGTISRVVYSMKKRIFGISNFGGEIVSGAIDRVKTAVELRKIADELRVDANEMIRVFMVAGEIYERVNCIELEDVDAA